VARESFLSPQKFRVIPNCLDINRYTPKPLLERQMLILHMGAQDYKQPLKTIQAFSRMDCRATRLILVGHIPAAVREEVERMPATLRERVELPGIVPAATLKELLCSARLVSVPSNYIVPVASPTVLEALAAHTPAVVSESISKIVIKDRENCLVATTVEQMAKAFDQLCTDDPLWAKLSAGCERTKVRFASTTVAEQYVQLAHELHKRFKSE
jgi:glycosyltransferase involved in cell wall biosynthesis